MADTEAPRIVTGDGGPGPQQSQPVTPAVQPAQKPAQKDSAPQPEPPVQSDQQSTRRPPAQASSHSAAPDTPAPANPVPSSVPADGVISWTASEFISHEKSASWYGMLILVAVVIAALVYLLTRDMISTAVVVVAALAFAVVAGRRPRQLQYSITNNGVSIGQKQFPYGVFKSFSVAPEGAFSSITFKPLKRFAPLTTIYYSPNDEQSILNLLSQHLPYEEHRSDPVDNVMRRIRF